MEKITSFCIDHDTLKKGLYISRIDGDIITYDMRMCEPNKGNYLDNAPLHTFEHLLATYVRNTKYSKDVIYAGPMGCRTGFYFLCRDKISRAEVIKLLQDACKFIENFEGVVPGTQVSGECGNYLDHDLSGAKIYGKEYRKVIKDWNVEDLNY
ncbi:MAG: S-ribosylhomocysteine lyase [Erysipelotrichaceae bacterium]